MTVENRYRPPRAAVAQASTAASEHNTTYCDHCGTAADSADHSACRRLRELEPPRYCRSCRRRLVVQVLPRGWSAWCSAHGDVST